MFDMFVTCFSLVAWIGLLARQGTKRYLGWVWYAAATGLGILAKGPVILVYIIPPALLAPWWMNKEQENSWRSWYGCFFLAVTAGAALALAWAIPAALAGGDQYAHAIFLGQTAGRMLDSFAHQRPFYWYLPLLPLLLFPWFFLPSIWFGLVRLRLCLAVRFCLSILAPALLILSSISGKQIHYVLPLLPLTAILFSQALFSHGKASGNITRELSIVLLLLSLILFTAPMLAIKGGDSEILSYVPQWIWIGPLAAAMILYFSRPPEQSNAIMRTTFVLVAVVIFFHIAFRRPLHAVYDAVSTGVRIHEAQEEGKSVAVHPARLSDQFQFAGRLTAPLLPQKKIEDAMHWLKENPGHFLLLFLRSKEPLNWAECDDPERFKGGWLFFCSSKNGRGRHKKT